MTLWTIAHQAPLSTGFSRQEYWSGFPCPHPGDLQTQGSNSCPCVSCIGRQVLYCQFVVLLIFLFYFGGELIYNVVLVSDVQQSDSVIHIQISVLFQLLLPCRLLHHIE